MSSSGHPWTDGRALVAVGRCLTCRARGRETCRARPDRPARAGRGGLPGRRRGPRHGRAGGRGTWRPRPVERGTSKQRWSPFVRRPGAPCARSWPRSAPGGCSTGPPGWPRQQDWTSDRPRSSSSGRQCNEELGATRAAERDLLRARRLLGDKAPPALEQQTAVMHQNAGRIAEAAAIYRKALKRRDLPVDVRAKMSNNLAMIEAQLGRYGVALALTGRARALAEEVGPLLTGRIRRGRSLRARPGGPTAREPAPCSRRPSASSSIAGLPARRAARRGRRRHARPAAPAGGTRRGRPGPARVPGGRRPT